MNKWQKEKAKTHSHDSVPGDLGPELAGVGRGHQLAGVGAGRAGKVQGPMKVISLLESTNNSTRSIYGKTYIPSLRSAVSNFSFLRSKHVPGDLRVPFEPIRG